MKWKVELREIDSLYENVKNPRSISKKDATDLSDSLEEFGLCEPVVIQPDGQIIGGHQRVRILKEKGVSHLNVSVPENPLDARSADKLTIRLNKNTGDWDFDILANEWEEGLLLESGFENKELGLDDIEEESGKKKTFSLTAKFKNAHDLMKAEEEISSIIEKYDGASYKTKR